MDLSSAVVFAPKTASAREVKAAAMLVEEVAKRSGVHWKVTNSIPQAGPVISVGRVSALGLYSERLGFSPDLALTNRHEGYQISAASGSSGVVTVAGNDERGVFFGVGRLLQELQMGKGKVQVSDTLKIATSPAFALRGHQLGYRPKCNSYDAWDLKTWDQYFRDLAVFGCNAIEHIPPRSDDDSDSPHFPLPPMEMMVGMSELADSYGLDVWVWFPAMDKDYSDSATVEKALVEWAEVFKRLPRIDAVFVPGGDPGHTQPLHLLALLQKQTENLHRFHPKAQMWVSPQGFHQAWLDEFIEILRQEKPAWLTGVVYGPQVRVTLPKLRELVPSAYPIRHYPDIAHSRQCQFPVPDWDTAFAITEARECINPRPVDQAAIFNKMQPGTIGFLTYSEGCNDDVNKFIWSGLGWDPQVPVLDLLRRYSKYFIGAEFADDFAQGLLALERNWRGPLLSNGSVEVTLAQFQEMERSAPPALLRNWRFQQALFRAYYDAYIRRRLLFETRLEEVAMERLRTAREVGASVAMAAATEVFDQAVNRVSLDLRGRLNELGEALFQSIGMQLSVSKYKAIAADRGASLDTLDFPLNNKAWLMERFNRVRALKSEPEKLNAIKEILDWTNPGPGGFYDDLGDSSRQPHLVNGFSFEEDPSRMASCRVDFEEDLVYESPDETAGGARRMSWVNHAESLYDTPLKMHYSGLDPSATYALRVVYGGDNPKRKIRLVANSTTEIHGYIQRPVPFAPLEFVVPQSITTNGELDLSWFAEPGLGGNGRGCQVSEVWLLKSTQPSPQR